MSSEAILALIVIALLSGFAIAMPFLNERRERRQMANHQADSNVELEDQLTQVIQAVRDLDFDFDTGKVAEADYITHRKLLIGRGVSLLIRLDEALARQDDLDQHIEDLIAAYRA
jgi:hypothetical protein